MSAKIQEYRDAIDRALHDKSKPWTKYFEKAEAQINVNRVYIFVGKKKFFHHVYLYPKRCPSILTVVFCRRFGRIRWFIFSFWVWCGIDMQQHRIRVPSVHVNEGVGIPRKRR